MEVSTMSFISDNWKVNQFRTMNVSEKVQAFVILSFEMIFALAAFFTFSGVQVCYDTVSFLQQVLALLASVYAISSMVGYFRFNFSQNVFTSYVNAL
jgi:hypothetical protein